MSKIPDSFKFKNTPVVVKCAVEKEVEAVVKSTVLVPNNSIPSIPSFSPNVTEKVSESEVGLLNKDEVENQEKENQTKRGMDMFISKVMYYTVFPVMSCILYCLLYSVFNCVISFNLLNLFLCHLVSHVIFQLMLYLFFFFNRTFPYVTV